MQPGDQPSSQPDSLPTSQANLPTNEFSKHRHVSKIHTDSDFNDLDELIFAPTFNNFGFHFLNARTGVDVARISVGCRFWQPYVLGGGPDDLQLWTTTYDEISHCWDFSAFRISSVLSRRMAVTSPHEKSLKCSNAGVSALNSHIIVHGTADDTALRLFDFGDFSRGVPNGDICVRNSLDVTRRFYEEEGAMPATFVLGSAAGDSIREGLVFTTSQGKTHVGCWDCIKDQSLGLSGQVGKHRSSPAFLNAVGCFATAVYATDDSEFLLWDPRTFGNGCDPQTRIPTSRIACSLARVSDFAVAVGQAGHLTVFDVRTTVKALCSVSTSQSYPYGACRVVLKNDPVPKVVLTAIGPSVAMFDVSSGEMVWRTGNIAGACFGVAHLGEKEGPMASSVVFEDAAIVLERIGFALENVEFSLVLRLKHSGGGLAVRRLPIWKCLAAVVV